MNGISKNAHDDINVDYRRHDYDINEPIYKKEINSVEKNNKKDNICDCIYKLNIFGKRENKLNKTNEY